MQHPYPDSGDRPLYECHDCGNRVSSETHYGPCPQCGGSVRNIAVTRE